VRKYYQALGFDFNKVPFEKVGQEFIELYNKNLDKIKLQPGVEDLLKKLKQAEKVQVLISARKHSQLLKDVEKFGLLHYFDRIIGLDDDLARGKEHLVREYFEQQNIEPKKALFIGDTEHDCQIAKSLGAHIFTVANGHHSASRLMLCTQFVYANLQTLADFLFNA
jgi:phosphoglycolate phosphatase